MNILYLILLLIVVVITAIILQKISSSQEGFENSTTQQLPTINTCPHRMNSFIEGATYCCDGAVTGNQCQGRKVCAMSPGVTDISSCAQYLYDYTKLMSEKHCFSDMPHYYENDSQVPAISGCATQVNSDYSAPVDGSSEKNTCKVYLTEYENIQNVDSCANKKMEVALQQSDFCKQVGCTTSIWKWQTNPPLHIATYSNPAAITNGSTAGDPNISPKTCQWQPSSLRYVQTVFPDDQNLINKVTEGSLAWICGYVPPLPCNQQKAIFTFKLMGPGRINISQIVLKDSKGKNITQNATIYASESLMPDDVKKENVIDGVEETRGFPNVYISKSTDKDAYIQINPYSKTCIRQVIIYGNSNADPTQNADKVFTLAAADDQGGVIYTSPPTTKDLIQTFNIPPDIYK